MEMYVGAGNTSMHSTFCHYVEAAVSYKSWSLESQDQAPGTKWMCGCMWMNESGKERNPAPEQINNHSHPAHTHHYTGWAITPHLLTHTHPHSAPQ
jgi:hypothetical protein